MVNNAAWLHLVDVKQQILFLIYMHFNLQLALCIKKSIIINITRANNLHV